MASEIERGGYSAVFSNDNGNCSVCAVVGDFETRRVTQGIKPRTSCDGEWLDWYDDAKAYGAQLDAPESIPAGSTVGATPASPVRGRRISREHPSAFETNTLIHAA